MQLQFPEIGISFTSTQKRKRAGSLASEALQSSPSAPLPTSARRPVLRSSFRPPKVFTRNPPMVQLPFTRTTANFQPDGSVKLVESKVEERIEVAEDWESGEEAFDRREVHQETGFIGRGYTKRGIYVRRIINTCLTYH